MAEGGRRQTDAKSHAKDVPLMFTPCPPSSLHPSLPRLSSGPLKDLRGKQTFWCSGTERDRERQRETERDRERQRERERELRLLTLRFPLCSLTHRHTSHKHSHPFPENMYDKKSLLSCSATAETAGGKTLSWPAHLPVSLSGGWCVSATGFYIHCC